MHHHFATVRCRIMLFAPKCSAKITVCQIFVNKLTILWQTVRTGSVISDITCHQTGEDRLLFPTTLNRQTGYLTHLIWILRIIQFGVLFSSWYTVRFQKITNIHHPKQVLNSCCDMISQELIVLRMEILSTFLLVQWCLLVANFFCHHNIENVECIVDVFWVSYLPAAIQRIFN